MRQLTAGQVANMSGMPLPLSWQNMSVSAQQGGLTPTPGAMAGLGFDPSSPEGFAPVPGSGLPGDGMAIDIPGGGEIPVPGTGPAGSMAGLAAPVPGDNNPTGPIYQTNGSGGLKAGRGTADYGNTATQAMAARRTGVVGALPTGEGPSQQRVVEAGPHREATQREARKMAVDFVKQQEQSLADEPLPASRREQVLRYFTALRSRLLDYQSTPAAVPGGK
jgi:hypothetical protein